MKLREIGDEAQDYSRTLSTLTRHLSLAGIAFVWVFSGPQNSREVVIPDDLTRIALVLVGALALDFLQYVWGALAWSRLRRVRERKHGTDREQDVGDAPDWINRPTYFFFLAKAGAVVLAYVLLSFALWSRLS